VLETDRLARLAALAELEKLAQTPNQLAERMV